MANPVGSVPASPTTLNHFYPDLKPTFDQLFELHSDRAKNTNVTKLFRQETMDGRFVNSQTWMSAPNPAPIIRGQAIKTAGFGELTFTLTAFDYGTPKMGFHVNDEQDSRAPIRMRQRIEQGAQRLAVLEHYWFPELLTGAASTYLHPSTSFTTIFGGTAGLFSSSHLYNGQTLDNSNVGRGTSLANVHDDVFTVRQTFRGMVDSEGNPYWDAMKTSNMRMLIVIPKELEQVFDALQVGQTTVQTGTTAPSDNYWRRIFGEKTDLYVEQRLTDTNNWYVFRISENDGLFPFISASRKETEQYIWNATTSDEARENFSEYYMWWQRKAVGIGVPQTGVEITN